MKNQGQSNWMPTCGVGEGGAASTGDRVEALLASLHKATAPSSCCLELDEPRRPISNSRPTWTDAHFQNRKSTKGVYTKKKHELKYQTHKSILLRRCIP